MKCHYEVLGIGRDANDSEIKTAYRKLALRWHPDKNPNQMEEAKEQFQLLQQAYEVLSDSHERAWYDNHREQILRGKNSDYEENCLDLFQYFTVSCFNGYGNDPSSFYSVYDEVFNQITAEDVEFMDDEEDIKLIPQFGTAKSSYEEVVSPFYAYWQSYCTKKSYAWLCPYNVNEIKDRRVLREIEKETKKIAQKAKRERNEEVRNLASFVRKRDRRVQANKKLLEQKAALNRLKQTQNRLDQIRRRNQEMEENREKQDSAHNEEYEEQLRQLAQEYDDLDAEENLDSSSVTDELADSAQHLDLEDLAYTDDLYCVACNKSFKNDNAFLNHETSKKHRENVETLKSEMKCDAKQFEKTEDSLDNFNGKFGDDEIAADFGSEDEVVAENKLKEKKNKKAKRNKPEIEQIHEEHLPDILGDLANEQDNWADEKKGKKTRSKKSNVKSPQTPVARLNADELVSPIEPAANSSVSDIGHNCVTCKTEFVSKNKLFSHLKQTGHGVYIPKTKQHHYDLPTSNKKGKRNK